MAGGAGGGGGGGWLPCSGHREFAELGREFEDLMEGLELLSDENRV